MKTPRQYQSAAIDLGIRRNILLADQTGLGKTLVSIEIIRGCRALANGPVLIIAPKKTIPQWQEAILDQIPDATILIGSKHFSPDVAGPFTWVVIHYEAVVAAAAALARVKWLVAVVDEAHRIKTRSTHKRPIKRTDAVKSATVQAQRKIAVTGTPWDRNPADVWSILNWLYPRQYTSYWAFYEKYALRQVLTYGDATYEKVIGCKDSEQLAKELSPFTLARTKHQVAPELPPRIDRVVHVDLEPKQQRLYKQLMQSNDIIALLSIPEDQLFQETVILNHLSLLIKLLQISSDPELLGFGSVTSGKLEWLDEYLTDNATECIVIFTRFRKTAIKLAEKYNGDLIVGGKDTGRPGEAFLNGEKRLLFGTIAAMREGLNLQRASTAIFVDQDWSSIMMSQGVDRIHRIDITEPKQVIFLKSTPSDELVYKAFTQKWDVARIVVEFLNQIRGGSYG